MTPSEILVTQKEKRITAYYPNSTSSRFNPVEHIEDLSYRNFEFKNLTLSNGDNGKCITENNVILMQFCLQGECLYQTNDGKKPLSFKTSTYNIIYIPKGDFYINPISDEVNLLNIYIDEHFFFRQMPENHLAFTCRNKNTFSSVFTKNLYINAKLANTLNEITSCEFDGHLKTLYLKAKVIELIALQLAQAAEKKTISLKSSEIERMMEVKELIENNLQESYSLAYLARVSGTNEQYLKKHFKILYGNTVFGYMLACKMQKAKALLLNEKHRIAEVAEKVGYSHATHFTNAFKKFFGYLPRVLKTKIVLGGCFSLNIELQLLEILMEI